MGPDRRDRNAWQPGARIARGRRGRVRGWMWGEGWGEVQRAQCGEGAWLTAIRSVRTIIADPEHAFNRLNSGLRAPDPLHGDTRMGTTDPQIASAVFVSPISR